MDFLDKGPVGLGNALELLVSSLEVLVNFFVVNKFCVSPNLQKNMKIELLEN